MTPTGNDNYIYTQLVCFLNHNLASTLGCICAGWIKWPRDASLRSQMILLGLALAKMALAPMLLLCNVAPGNRNTQVNYKMVVD